MNAGFNVLFSNLVMDASKKIVATGILVFDFELFIGGRYRLVIGCNRSLLAKEEERRIV